MWRLLIVLFLASTAYAQRDPFERMADSLDSMRTAAQVDEARRLNEGIMNDYRQSGMNQMRQGYMQMQQQLNMAANQIAVANKAAQDAELLKNRFANQAKSLEKDLANVRRELIEAKQIKSDNDEKFMNVLGKFIDPIKTGDGKSISDFMEYIWNRTHLDDQVSISITISRPTDRKKADPSPLDLKP